MPASTSSLDDKNIEAGRLEEKAHLPSVSLTPLSEVEPTHRLQSTSSVLRALRRAEAWIDSKVGIELQGIDRVMEDEKSPPSTWNMALLWCSLNLHVGTLVMGILGAEFGLNLKQNIAATTIGTLVGALCPAFTGTMSPKTGLRQLAISRYSFGFWGAKLCSVLSIVVGGGFYVVNLVIVGQLLSAVTSYTLTLSLGIVIVAVVSFVISIFGYRLIHTYEKYSWIVTFVVFIVLLAQVAPLVDVDAPPKVEGLALTGSFLSILAITLSNASGWATVPGDYLVHYPASISRSKVAALTWIGIVTPVIFSTVLGCLLGNVGVTTAIPPYAEAYESHGLGGLIATIYHPAGWSKLCLVILTFSVLGNTIAINYSAGLALQLLGHVFHAIPRFIWTFLFAVVVTGIAIAGQQHLSTIVANFVSLLGYWTIAYTVILAVEDVVFRRRRGYDVNCWNDSSRLPLGLAAVLSLLCGYLCGGLPGAAQTWYVGPLAAKVGGPSGGDVGVYMTFLITLLVYPMTRFLELKYSRR